MYWWRNAVYAAATVVGSATITINAWFGYPTALSTSTFRPAEVAVGRWHAGGCPGSEDCMTIIRARPVDKAWIWIMTCCLRLAQPVTRRQSGRRIARPCTPCLHMGCKVTLTPTDGTTLSNQARGGGQEKHRNWGGGWLAIAGGTTTAYYLWVGGDGAATSTTTLRKLCRHRQTTIPTTGEAHYGERRSIAAQKCAARHDPKHRLKPPPPYLAHLRTVRQPDPI